MAGAVLLLVPAGCGGGDDEDKAERKDPFKAVDKDFRTRRSRRAAPRWEPVAELSGRGSESESFEISRRAIQWRVRYSCRSRRIALSVSPRPESGPASVRKRCQKKGEASWITNGRVRLSVAAPSRWSATVEQQVDTPLDEPPLRAMRASGASVAGRGSFYSVERKSRGKALLYRLANGRLALRFEDFRTSANSDLYVWLSEAQRPRTTKEVLAAPHNQIALLKSTLGSQNYLLPRNVDAGSFRSIVIWCEPVLIAYGAAALSPQ